MLHLDYVWFAVDVNRQVIILAVALRIGQWLLCKFVFLENNGNYIALKNRFSIIWLILTVRLSSHSWLSRETRLNGSKYQNMPYATL